MIAATSPFALAVSRLPRQRQRGAVLVVGLIFLALLTLIGVTAFSVATQEERMAGNARDRLRAFEAAEAALRHCESLLNEQVPPDFGNDPGMFITPADSVTEKWESVDWAKESLKLPDDTVPGVVEQPRCIIERLAQTRSNNPSLRAELPQPLAYAYKVTARGVGATPNTVVRLQTTYIRD